MFENIKADLARFKEDSGDASSLRVLIRGLVSQGFQAILVYRFFRWFHLRGIPTQPFRFLIERWIEITTGISIPAEMEIGKGLRIHHFGGVIFHSHVKMGTHCTIYQGVTVGDKGGRGEPPKIGNNVLIGAGAKILGDITVGNNVVVGANAVVVSSLPDNVVAVGIPAKVVAGKRDAASLPEVERETARKINVMQCRSTYTTGGGPDKTVLLIAEKADPEKFEITIMYMRGARDEEFQIAKWAKERGLRIHEVIEKGKLDLANLRQINQLIRDCDIDIFHARDYKTCFVGFMLGMINPSMKLIFTAHGWIVDSAKMKFYTWLNLISLKRYHKTIAVSEATKKVMVDNGIDERKIEVVYNAIDVDVWQRDRVISTFRDESQISVTSKVVGVVGRLRYEKDIPTTLDVAERVIRKRPNTYFVFVGDGPDKEEAGRTVEKMGLTKNIRFVGFRKDALNVYAALDVFASTSLTEGTPNTVLEAMAMEVPVVHTAVGGVPEMIEDGYDGILCQVGDVNGIAQAILSLLDDEEKSALLRQRARQSVCTKFSLAKRLKMVETIYEEVAQA